MDILAEPLPLTFDRYRLTSSFIIAAEPAIDYHIVVSLYLDYFNPGDGRYNSIGNTMLLYLLYHFKAIVFGVGSESFLRRLPLTALQLYRVDDLAKFRLFRKLAGQVIGHI